MGFITQRNWQTGREVYACEVGSPQCVHIGCRARKCPFGWCQRYYVCHECWKLPTTKAQFTKAAHETCRVRQEDYATINQRKMELLKAGYAIRRAAISTQDGRVHVLFQRLDGTTIGKVMAPETYDAIPLLIAVTPEEYAKHGLLEEAPGTFANGQTTKEVVGV